MPQGYVFDAYGTLFDTGSIAADPALLALWRRKQLEYTWLRSLMGRWEDFWKVTEDALRFAARSLGKDVPIDPLMKAYLTLAPFPEVPAALDRLKGRPLAILSNGTPAMLDAAVTSSGLAGRFAHVLSVDAVRVYKPSPAVYAMAPKALGVEASELLFVSSNAWDVAGAKAFGYRVCWCNRLKAPMDELGVQPDRVVERLDQL
ncbi:MAG TPA: haloacid dehalogenase type II [Planctomycetota bacterium]|nr:haloacid dehalogenase type II [Planctomycetota bacterium]